MLIVPVRLVPCPSYVAGRERGAVADPRVSPDLDRLAGQLRRLRVAAGYTQEELAGRAGLSDRTVRDMERGQSRPRRPPGGCWPGPSR